MATLFDATSNSVQTGIPLGATDYQPIYPALSGLIATEDFSKRPPAQNPQYDPSVPFLPPPSFGSIVDSVYPLTLATQFDPPSYTPPSCNGTTSLYPAYPKLPVLHNSWQFRPTETKFSPPPIVHEDFKEKIPVLSQKLLGEIDRLTTLDYDDYHPWQVEESQPIHAIITKISAEITHQFPRAGTQEGFMQCLALCEKAIYEIEQLPQINSENKAMLELGIRDTLSRYIEVFQGNCLGEEFERTKVIPPHIENIPFYLNQFETRGGHYLPSAVRDRFDELLTRINYNFITGLNGVFDQQNLDQLPLSAQFDRCHALINEQLTRHATTPNACVHLQWRAHQTIAQSFINHHAPLFKEAYEKGLPLPADLSQMLDGLYRLASNNYNFIVTEDPRQTFLLSVFGTDDPVELRKQITRNAQAEKAAIEQASTPTGEPVQPKSFWSRFNIFSKAQTPEQLAREATTRKDASLFQVDLKERGQTLAIDQLERYVLGIHQPTIMMPTGTTYNGMEPSAPPFEFIEKLYPQLDTIATTPVVGDKSDAPVMPTKPVIHSAASQKVTVTFPALPQKSKPTGSYIHIAFHDLLERTTADEDLFAQFPKPVQRDLMRHLFHTRLVGPAEARIENAFKKNVDGTKVAHVNILYTRELTQLDKQLKTTKRTPEQQQGEEILNLYYQGKQNDSAFLDKLNALPISDLFLYYVWDIAKNVNVEIPETDHDWARGHYKDPEFVHLTMQALERLLHTS